MCDLHTGELGIGHLITALDGPTESNIKWSGYLGKMLYEATELEVDKNFSKLDLVPQLPQLPEMVIHDLNTDQSYAYKTAETIRTGILIENLACWKLVLNVTATGSPQH